MDYMHFLPENLRKRGGDAAPRPVTNVTVNKKSEPFHPRLNEKIQTVPQRLDSEIRLSKLTQKAPTYHQPTVSSQLKANHRRYLHSLSMKPIPFFPTSSTATSHNIGVHVQQTMNVMKTYRPVSGLSPTLQHKISVDPGSTGATLLSNMNHLPGNPAIKRPRSYTELDEHIPPTMPQMIPSKIQRSPEYKVNANTTNQRFKTSNPTNITVQTIKAPDQPVLRNIPTSNTEKNRKKLKQILMNLHNEFEEMNKRYEELSMRGRTITAEEKLEFQLIEAKLKMKEEEINLVMTLFNEVMSLQKQVQKLTASNRQGVPKPIQNTSKFTERVPKAFLPAGK